MPSLLELAQARIDPCAVYNSNGFHALLLALCPDSANALPRDRKALGRMFRPEGDPKMGKIDCKRLGNDYLMTGAAILRWLGAREPGYCRCCGQRLPNIPE